MKIEWLGHSCFKLTESTGTSVITDPFDPYFGIDMPEVTADAVTISHKHKDHSALDKVKEYKEVFDSTGGFEFSGIHIYSFMSFHDEKKGALRGKNLIFKFGIDGVDVTHLGDVGEPLTPMLAELIAPTNVLLIPVGGKYTISPEVAKEYIDLIMPDVVIPMHYQTENCEMDILELDEFLDLFNEDIIEYVDGNSIEFDRTNFDGEATKIIIFKKEPSKA